MGFTARLVFPNRRRVSSSSSNRKKKNRWSVARHLKTLVQTDEGREFSTRVPNERRLTGRCRVGNDERVVLLWQRAHHDEYLASTMISGRQTR